MSLFELQRPIYSCKELKNVPKLCIVQACRGDFNADQGIVREDASRRPSQRFQHEAKDSFIMHAAVEGNPAWAHNQNGSFLFKHLAEAIEQNGRTSSLNMIERDVIERVSKEQFIVETETERKRVALLPRVEHSLTKKLVFTREAANNEVSFIF